MVIKTRERVRVVNLEDLVEKENPDEDSEHIPFRIEIFKEHEGKKRFSSRVWREKCHQILATFPQEQGIPRDTCSNDLHVEDMRLWQGDKQVRGISPEDVLQKVLARIDQHFQLPRPCCRLLRGSDALFRIHDKTTETRMEIGMRMSELATVIDIDALEINRRDGINIPGIEAENMYMRLEIFKMYGNRKRCYPRLWERESYRLQLPAPQGQDDDPPATWLDRNILFDRDDWLGDPKEVVGSSPEEALKEVINYLDRYLTWPFNQPVSKPGNTRIEMCELIRVIEVDLLGLDHGIKDYPVRSENLHLRIEIFKRGGETDSCFPRLWRRECYRIQPWWPHDEEGNFLSELSEENLLVEEVDLCREVAEVAGTNPQEVMKKVSATLSKRLGFPLDLSASTADYNNQGNLDSKQDMDRR